jgi:hypothetical protein
MNFIFAETQGMQTAAATAANLATDTVNAGAQGQAAGMTVVPPGLDHVSASNAAHIKASMSQIATQLATGAGLQDIYGTSISTAANAYTLVDELNATGLGGLV